MDATDFYTFARSLTGDLEVAVMTLRRTSAGRARAKARRQGRMVRKARRPREPGEAFAEGVGRSQLDGLLRHLLDR